MPLRRREAALVLLVLSAPLGVEGELQDRCEPHAGEAQSASLLESGTIKRRVLFGRQDDRLNGALSAVRTGEESSAESAKAFIPGTQAGDGWHAASAPASPSEHPRRVGELALSAVAALRAEGARLLLLDKWGGARSRTLLQARSVVDGQGALVSSHSALVVLLLAGFIVATLAAGICGIFAPSASKRETPPALLPGPGPSPKQPPTGAPPESGPYPAAESRRTGLLEPTPAPSEVSLGGRASQMGVQHSVPHLCPGLLVPEECECTLLVPRLDPGLLKCQVTVDDARSVPVFRVTYRLPSRSEALSRGQASSRRTSEERDGNRCLVLSGYADDQCIFGFCRVGLDGAFTILDENEKPFGLIRARVDRSGFEVATRVGSLIQLNCTRENDIVATDRAGLTLALTEPLPGTSLRRMVRIGPLVDAGLVTLCILAIDVLEGMQKAELRGGMGTTSPFLRGAA